MSAIKPHGIFSIWRPDEVAECLEGVGMENGLYQALWDFVPRYKKLPEPVEEPTPGVNALDEWWDELSPEHQEALNKAAMEMEAKYR